MAPPPFMNNHHHHLLWYLDKYFSRKESMELTTETLDSQHHLPWNRETCLFVLTYVVQFCSNLELCEFTSEIMALDEIAKSVHASYIKQQEEIGDVKRTQNQGDYVDESNKKQQEFSKLLVNSFVPDVLPRFFTVPKLQQLPDKDNNLKPIEILTGFIDFLLQVLYHEAVTSEDEEQQGALALLRKQLSFLFVVLGDIPFQSGHHELAGDVINLLVEFEVLANEAGTLIYACVFHIHLEEETSRFNVRANALSEKFELLSAQIKEHCIKFAKLPLSVIPRSGVTDSFDIIPSLIVDIENLLNRRLGITHDDSIKDQLMTLHGGLKFLQTLILVSQVPPNEQKGALIQIIDLAYEVEYLISSHVVGNMHVWYLNLRLPSLIERIKLSCKGLQQISEVHASKAMNSFENVVSLRSKEDSRTMEDNNCVDVNSDITQKNNYSKKLDLSYKRLPYYLKPCSLYVATFPKDVEISREQLAWMWIVDGHIEEKEKLIAEDCSIAEASNLRSVSFVCIYKEKEEEILRHLLHICKLECIYGGDAVFPDINFFTELESLEFCFNISLRDVTVADFNFPSTVKKLCLSGAVLTGEHMSIIGRLPNLQVLKLENHAFVGDEWELKSYADEFEELRLLKIESRDLREWSCGSLNFPILECLVLTGCITLDEIPSDLGAIPTTLERIEVLKCGPGAYRSAFEIIEEQYHVYENYELHLVTDMKRSLPEEFKP